MNLQKVISGLPVSNWDHAVNGGTFLDDGTLVFAIGGNTNRGVPFYALGGLPESPFSAAIIEAQVLMCGIVYNSLCKFLCCVTNSLIP